MAATPELPVFVGGMVELMGGMVVGRIGGAEVVVVVAEVVSVSGRY